MDSTRPELQQADSIELKSNPDPRESTLKLNVPNLGEDVAQSQPDGPKGERKAKTFWLVLASLVVSIFIVTLEATAVGNVLPTIASDLHIAQFIWIGTTYQLASTAWLPLGGGLAQIFGRRPVMLASLVVFAVGGAVSGAANGEAMLFTGRTIQGLGAGGVYTLSSIILSDLVPLRERGIYNGLLGLAWTAAAGIAPVVGGALAQTGQWRWLFYMTIPIAGFSATLVLFFVRLPTPPGNLRSKLEQIDWIGNFTVMGSSTAIVIAMTWGGVLYPWSAARVLVPLILGFVGLAAFLLYEALWAKYPLVPISLLRNRTTLSGYIQTLVLSIPTQGLVYYLPVYYQACKNASPIASGVDLFGTAFTIAPMSVVSGVIITVTKKYRPPIWFGWGLVLIGHGLLSTLHADTSRAKSIGYQIILGSGIGLVYSSIYFPVLAPLPVSSNAPALALYMFLRTFSQVWGVAIGGSVLQNQLVKHLPVAFTSQFPAGTELAYAAIPTISSLPRPLQVEVQNAFATSLDVVWRVQLIISAVGMLASLFMRSLPLHTETDRKWDATAATDQ